MENTFISEWTMPITYWSGITVAEISSQNCCHNTEMDGQKVFNPQENSPTNKLAQNEILIFVKN